MGLDMYLYKKTYVRNWEHQTPEEKHSITIKKGGKKRTDIKPERINEISELVGEWRKFNALHNWFVQNCGEGEDTCQEMYVTEEHIKDLLNTLKQVSSAISKSKLVVKVLQDWNGKNYDHKVYDCENKVKKLLSPAKGFFFGSQEVDEWYKEDVERTIVLLEELLKEQEQSKKHGLFSGEFYYQASW